MVCSAKEKIFVWLGLGWDQTRPDPRKNINWEIISFGLILSNDIILAKETHLNIKLVWFGWKQNKRQGGNPVICRLVKSFPYKTLRGLLVPLSPLPAWCLKVSDHWEAAPGQLDISARRGGTAPAERRKNRWTEAAWAKTPKGQQKN